MSVRIGGNSKVSAGYGTMAALFLSTMLVGSSGAAAASPYPVREALAAFGDVCFDTTTARQDDIGNAGKWRDIALQKGWSEIATAPAAGEDFAARLMTRTFYWAKALDYELLTALGQTGSERMGGEFLLTKSIGGRRFYLSIVGMDASNTTLAECRLRDPLGDGIYKSPITRPDVESWLGHAVKASRGWYRGKQYSWSRGNGTNSVRVHFDFDSKPIGKYGAKYDPYALYGMTLVRSDYSEIIVT
jgi:hypothetical protein